MKPIYFFPFPDELPASEVRSVNLLADLVQRFYAEQDHLIGHLRSLSADASEQVKELPLVLLRLEIQHSKLEDWFDIGTIGLGLLERVAEVLKGRCVPHQFYITQITGTMRMSTLTRFNKIATHGKGPDFK